jgi:hypothetical protein
MQHDELNYAAKLVAALAQPGLPSSVTTAYVSARLGVAWRTLSRRLLARKGVQQAIAILGFEYRPAPGRRGGCFARVSADRTQELSEVLALPWPTIVAALLFYSTASGALPPI